MISITSPSAFCLLMSIRTISVAMSSLESVYAMVAPTLPAPITVILLFIVPDHFPSCAVPDGEHNVPPRARSSELHENKGAKHSFPLSPLTGYILSLINSIISISFYQAFSRFFYMKISEFTAFSESKTKAARASFEFDTSFTNTNSVFRSLCEKSAPKSPSGTLLVRLCLLFSV